MLVWDERELRLVEGTTVELLYCENCNFRLSANELQAGTAFWLDEKRILCAQCAPLFCDAMPFPQSALLPVMSDTASYLTALRPMDRAEQSQEGSNFEIEGGEHEEDLPEAEEPLPKNFWRRSGVRKRMMVTAAATALFAGAVGFVISSFTGSDAPPQSSQIATASTPVQVDINDDNLFKHSQNAAAPSVPAKNDVPVKPAMNAAPAFSAPAKPVELVLELGGKIKMEFVLISAGQFEMGSNKTKNGESPVHTVKISNAFYMGKYPVTQDQYEAVLGNNPSRANGGDLPVEFVTFLQAQEFCKKAGERTGKPIRLPTEAEWEYACRAGSKTRFSDGDDDSDMDQEGWHRRNSDHEMHPVGQKKPNAWNLYDMHGNVWEWCRDYYEEDYYTKSPIMDPQGPETGSSRVARGGSFRCDANGCRSSARMSFPPEHKNQTVGFRTAFVRSVESGDQ